MTKPKTNEEIMQELKLHAIIEHSYGEGNNSIEVDNSFIIHALTEARRSAIQEAIAKLEAKGVVPDNYVGIQDAIALLEKMKS